MTLDKGILETTARTAYGAIENVNANLVDWRAVDGQPGNYIKVLLVNSYYLLHKTTHELETFCVFLTSSSKDGCIKVLDK